MKSFYTILLILFLTSNASAQNSLSGTVKDKESGSMLVGASLYFPDLKKGTTADKNGAYTLTDLPEGKYLLQISYLGFETQVLRVNIRGAIKLEVEMKTSHTELNEVVITGTSVATEKAINPVQTISIDKVSLQQSSAANIIEALSNKPGLSQITSGAGISKPVIRGLGYNRVVVLQNNIRQEGQQWGDEHGIEIDQFSFEKAEIIKGPGSLMYGSDAMAGVINLLAPAPVEEGKFAAEFMSSYHLNNNMLGYSLRNGGNIQGKYWQLQGTAKKAGNYSNRYDGKVLNSGFYEMNLSGNAGINRKWGYAQVNFSTFNQSIGVIEGNRDSTGNFVKPWITGDSVIAEITATKQDLDGYKLFIPRQLVNHHRISTTNSFIMGHSRLNVTLGWQQNHRREFEFHPTTDKIQPQIEEAVSLYFLLNTFNFDAHYILPEYDGWESSLGLNGFHQTNRNPGEEFLIPEYALSDAGIFALTRKTFNKLNVSGGIRYNARFVESQQLILDANGQPVDRPDSLSTIKFTPLFTDFSALSFSAGCSYRITETVIGKFNVSSGFRAPTLAELASNGRHEGALRYEIGNSFLNPETSLQSDGGLLLNTEHISLEMDIFSNNIRHYIFAEKLNNAFGNDSIVLDDGDTVAVFKFTQGNARLLGGEITMDFHPHPFDWLHFENSFSYVEGRLANQPDSATCLPLMPAPKFQTELRAEFKKAGNRLKNFYVFAECNYYLQQDKIYSAFGTETITPSYSLLNAGIGTEVVNKNGNTLFSVHCIASNLLDVSYQHHLSRLKYASENPVTGRTGVFNMGRNIMLELIVPVTWQRKPAHET